jgi:hypothetical protein
MKKDASFILYGEVKDGNEDKHENCESKEIHESKIDNKKIGGTQN